MGKQGQQQRAALANALGAAGSKPVAPPTLKEEPKPPPVAPKRKPAPAPEQAEPKTRKELEEEQRRTLEERDRQRKEFFDAEAARKLQENLPADKGVTYVEDRDSRKPVAVEDLSEYWVSDLGFLPFMPSDNVGATEVPGGVDPLERLDFLRMLSDQLRQVLRMRFNVFWSQVLHDGQFRRCLDSYLRFCLRRHDVGLGQGEQQDDEDTMGDEEEQKLSREISRRVLAVMIRLSRPQETTHDFISEDKYAEFIYEKRIFDIPKLIDLCAVYGDANRDTVTKLVHSVMSCQPRYREEFEGLVRHMHGGLRQCCAPLQDGGVGGDFSELSVEECLTFLPDILSCFVAMFCFFPEDLVGRLVEARLDGSAGGASKGAGGAALPLADVMVSLHEAVWALKSSMGDDPDLEPPWSGLGTVISLLSRLLSCVLGFHMAPRRGAAAFQELLDWLREHSERPDELLGDLARHGLENVAMEWCASGLVDDEQLDYLEELCGRLLPKEARAARRRPAARAAPGAAGAGAAPSGPSGSSSSGAGASGASDAAKIREVREVVGTEYGDGFVLQCLLHYGGSVPSVVGHILDGSLPPQLTALPKGMKLGDSSDAGQPGDTGGKLSAEEKRRIMDRNDRMLVEEREKAERARAMKAGEIPPDKPDKARTLSAKGYASLYDDDADEDALVAPAFRAAAGGDDESDDSGEDGSSSSGEFDDRWGGDKGKGKGKGRGKDRGPVQGQTIQARRKEENKARVANHNRRAGAMAKMRKGML